MGHCGETARVIQTVVVPLEINLVIFVNNSKNCMNFLTLIPSYGKYSTERKRIYEHMYLYISNDVKLEAT